MTTTAPYGSWKSPVDAADTVAALLGFEHLAVDGGAIYWTEMRPSEQGRQVLMTADADGAPVELAGPGTNTRTRVHEYGGASFDVAGGQVVRSEFADQRLYLVTPEGERVVTPEPPRPASVRFADGRFLDRGRFVCVRETHPEEGEATNELVVVHLDDGRQTVIATGRDFYAAPRPSPDGSRLAWLEWDHPNMPWDGTELKVAALSVDGGPGDVVTVAGGVSESVLQPEWAPDGSLVFSTDRSGWWNLHRWSDGVVRPILERDVDFGDPAWVFGRTTFGFLSRGRILAGYWLDGIHHLMVIGPDGSVTELSDELSSHEELVTDGASTAWFMGTGAATPTTIFRLDVDTGERQVVRANPSPVAPEFVPAAEIVTFPTDGGLSAHAVFYPPTNPDFAGPDAEAPPLIVKVHGGPTAQVYPRLAVSSLYWTSRGFAVVDVNYGGSTGYGRAYRERLRGNWGLVDVADSIAAARYLADTGRANPERLVITGGSAGGYTTMAALAFGDVFSAGASYFGVADIGLLADHTHKFESRYLDGLCGPNREVWKQRSPLYSADRIDAPMILFQGLEDRVVPPEQARVIAEVLRDNRIPYAHIEYPGEDHGFRKAENIVHSLESELAFYGRVLGFRPYGDLPEVPVVGF